jgi:uncharacterized protein (TIGR00251 family)
MPPTIPPVPLPDLAFLRMEKNGDVLVDVHVVPNATKTQAVGLHGEAGQQALRLRLQAPPVDGKANQALVKWLAGRLGIPQQAVTLARGETSRRKQLRVNAAAAGRAAWDELAKALGKDGPPA